MYHSNQQAERCQHTEIRRSERAVLRLQNSSEDGPAKRAVLRDVLDGVSIVLQPAVLASLDVLLLRKNRVYREPDECKSSSE